jgi:hypothetical protein
MNGCWSEGELRAYFDGELSARDMERVALHLEQCGVCGGRYAELSERARRVGALLDVLPEPVWTPKLPAIPQRSRPVRRWVTAGAALAASVALGVALAPRHTPLPQEKPPQTVLKVVPPPPAAAALPLRVQPAIVKRRLPAKPKPRMEYYIALDDEPLETGVVVRVGLDAGLNGGQIPADVIFGPDGRAHAIRLVTDIAGERK